MVVLLPVAYVRRGTTMKTQTVKERPKIAEGSDRAPRRSHAQHGARDSIEHPDGHDRSRAVRQLADRHQLAATVLSVDDGHALPELRVPGIVDLASVTDTGRMKRTFSNGARLCLARVATRANERSNAS